MGAAGRALTKTRMLSEIRILRHLEHKDTHTPRILDADINSGTIIMTRIAGRPLFEHLRSSSTQFVGRSDVGYSEEVSVRNRKKARVGSSRSNGEDRGTGFYATSKPKQTNPTGGSRSRQPAEALGKTVDR